MIAFNNLSGIVVLSVMLASTLGAAAPTPSNAENAPVSPFPFQGLGDAVGGLSPAALGSWMGNFQGFKRENTDFASPSSLRLRAEGENEGFFLPGVGTIENIHGTVVFKSPRKDVELKARAEGRVEEQATENLDFNISGDEISHFINSLSPQIRGRAEEDKNAWDSLIPGGASGDGGLLSDILGPDGVVGGLLGLKREMLSHLW